MPRAKVENWRRFQDARIRFADAGGPWRGIPANAPGGKNRKTQLRQPNPRLLRGRSAAFARYRRKTTNTEGYVPIIWKLRCGKLLHKPGRLCARASYLTYCEYPILSFNVRARRCPRSRSLKSSPFTARIRSAATAAFEMVSKAHLRRHVDDSQQVDFEAMVNRTDLRQRTDA